MIIDTPVESLSTDEPTATIDEDQEFEAEYATSDSNADFMNSAAAVGATRSLDFPALRDEYAHLWAELAIRRERLPEVDRIVDRLVGNEERYRAVERSTGVPWYFVGTIHNLEASGNFSKHLHNGDPLTARTVHVPAGRPAAGSPPFTWEQSAADALAFHRLTQVTDWTVERMAYEFERYNGFGYRQYHPHVKSPYLWSFSNHYTSGKYVSDGRWSETAVSQQCGAMVLLKRLQETGHLDLRYSQIAAADTSPELETFARDLDAAATVRMARPVESQLNEGPGIFGYYSASKRYGTAATIAALKEVGRIWLLRHTAPRVGVGDISLRGGGDIDGHASHETGRDVDLRPMKADGTEGPVTWTQGSYSRSLTQELIDIIYANGVVNVKVIGFNDPGVQGCVNWVNHDNHLHVRFYFDDESPGYPLVQLGVNNSPPVRECQRRLNTWKRTRGDTDLLIPDGDFGQSTLKAVRDFQDTMGLVVDGKVGNGTWKRTLDYLVSDHDTRIAEDRDIGDEISYTATTKTIGRRPGKANRPLAIPESGLEPRWTRARALQDLPQPMRGDAINLGPIAGTGSPTGAIGAGATDLCEISPSGLVALAGDTFAGNGAFQGDWSPSMGLHVKPGTLNGRIQFDRSFGGHGTLYAEPPPNVPYGSQLPAGTVQVLGVDYAFVARVANLYPRDTRLVRIDPNGGGWATVPGSLRDAAWQDFNQTQISGYHAPDGWVYIVADGFARDTRVWLYRCPAANFTDRNTWHAWGMIGGGPAWGWDVAPTPLSNDLWGELSLRLIDGKAVLSGFNRSTGNVEVRVADDVTQVLAPWTPVTVIATQGTVPQNYGGYIVPGSTLDQAIILVSQWNTWTNNPYNVQQFVANLHR